MQLKRFLGVEEFKDIDQVISFLKTSDSTIDFSNRKELLLESNKDIRLWLISSKRDLFLVKDDGFELKTLLRRSKENFKYDFVKEKNTPRLFIKDTTTTLPINTGLSRGTDSFQSSLTELIKA